MKDAAATRPELLTIREVADWLKLSERTIRKYIDYGILPTMKLPGGDVRIWHADVLAFLRSSRPVRS